MKNNFKKIVKMGIVTTALTVLISLPCFAASGSTSGTYSRHNYSSSTNSVGKYTASSQITNTSNANRYGQASVNVYDAYGTIIGSESVATESVINSSNSISVSKSGINANRVIYSSGYICNSPYSNSGVADSYSKKLH